jgi:cyanophycin synthetase
MKLVFRTLITRNLIHRLATNFVYKPYITNLHIPIIAITGTNGKTTVARLLERIYLDAGYNVGTCTTDGFTHNGALFMNGDMSWGFGAWKAARCPNADLLILETARGGILNYGIGFKKCQVGIVTNLYEDHLGFGGVKTLEEMADVKSSIPSHTDQEGSLILNGDNPYVRAMADKSPAKPIYFVIENDYRQFQNVFFLQEDFIYKKIGGLKEQIINVKDLPITCNGILGYNIGNVMAALAALEGMMKFIEVKNESALKTLTEFGLSPYDNINRFCLLTFQGESVLLDFCKNPECYRREIGIIEKIKQSQKFDIVVGVLTAPGNRQDKLITEISGLAASICDYFFVSPPKPEYLRGRNDDEIVRLISSKIPRNKILSDRRSSLNEVISLSRGRLEGKILFVIFCAMITANIDYMEVVEQAEFVYNFNKNVSVG